MHNGPDRAVASTGMIPPFEVRQLVDDELERVVEVDVTETDTTVLVQHGTDVAVREERWTRPARDAAAWHEHARIWRQALADGGAAWGAFAGDRLVGIIVLRRRVRPGTDQLLALFVDAHHRRRGIAGALVEALEHDSRGGNANAIVVSAAPSRSAVGTYLRHGYQPMSTPLPELLALEPEDIQMEKRLDAHDAT